MPMYRFCDKLLQNKTEICNGVGTGSSHYLDAPDDMSVPLPLGALAFSGSRGLLPTHITARGRVDPGGLATVWVAHTFRVPAAAPAAAHYFLPRRAMRRPPAYRAGVLYPPRAAVEHRGGAYRNGTNCDIFTKPPHKDWIFEGNLPSAWPTPWFCSEVMGIARPTQGGAPRVVSSAAPAPASTSIPENVSIAHCLLDTFEKDDTYCFVFDAIDKESPATATATADVTVIWALHNAVPSQMTFLLPSACFGSIPCQIQVHVEQPGAARSAPGEAAPGAAAPARICVESVRRQLQLPRIQAGRRVLWHAPALDAYFPACGGAGQKKPSKIHTAKVQEELKNELFDVAQVRALAPSPAAAGPGGGSRIWSWSLRARAMVRTELHLRAAEAPAPPPRCGLRLPAPMPWTLTQRCAPPAPLADSSEPWRLLVCHGVLIGCNRSIISRTSGVLRAERVPEWYSFEHQYQCVELEEGACSPTTVLWVVHVSDEHAPQIQWVPGTWQPAHAVRATEEDEWECPPIPCACVCSALARTCKAHKTSRQEMAASMLDGGEAAGPMAALLYLSMRTVELPWVAAAQQLALQWRAGGMRPAAAPEHGPLLAQVLQLISNTGGVPAQANAVAVPPPPGVQWPARAHICRENTTPPPMPFYYDSYPEYNGILSPQFAVADTAGNCSLACVRGHPYAQHLGPWRQERRDAATQLMLDVEMGGKEEDLAHVEGLSQIQRWLRDTYAD